MLAVNKRQGKGKGQPTKDDVRICIDPRDLNTALKREHHPTATIEEVANKLAGTVTFSTLDACSGFWQLPVDEASSKLLTFNTPWGRYRFCRLPFGIAPAPEIYRREMERLLKGVPVEIIVDDFLIHAKDKMEMNVKLSQVLERSREVGLKFNPSKVKLRVDEVRYVCHKLTSQGLQPDPEKIKAILDMPPPTDKVGVQLILGTVSYLQISSYRTKQRSRDPSHSCCRKTQFLCGIHPNKMPLHNSNASSAILQFSRISTPISRLF